MLCVRKRETHTKARECSRFFSSSSPHSVPHFNPFHSQHSTQSKQQVTAPHRALCWLWWGVSVKESERERRESRKNVRALIHIACASINQSSCVVFVHESTLVSSRRRVETNTHSRRDDDASSAPRDACSGRRGQWRATPPLSSSSSSSQLLVIIKKEVNQSLLARERH